MELIKKSENNFQSAGNLLNNSLFSSSIHCSYYSCFQTAVAVYVDISKKDYTVIQEEIRNTNKHVHSYYIDKLKGIYLSNSTDVNKYRTGSSMHKLYKSLQSLRIDADYNDIEICENTAKLAFEYCKKINDFLKSIK